MNKIFIIFINIINNHDYNTEFIMVNIILSWAKWEMLSFNKHYNISYVKTNTSFIKTCYNWRLVRLSFEVIWWIQQLQLQLHDLWKSFMTKWSTLMFLERMEKFFRYVKFHCSFESSLKSPKFFIFFENHFFVVVISISFKICELSSNIYFP